MLTVKQLRMMLDQCNPDSLVIVSVSDSENFKNGRMFKVNTKPKGLSPRTVEKVAALDNKGEPKPEVEEIPFVNSLEILEDRGAEIVSLKAQIEFTNNTDAFRLVRLRNWNLGDWTTLTDTPLVVSVKTEGQDCKWEEKYSNTYNPEIGKWSRNYPKKTAEEIDRYQSIFLDKETGIWMIETGTRVRNPDGSYENTPFERKPWGKKKPPSENKNE